MAYRVERLLDMSQKQLDDLFSSVPAGNIPKGEAKGTAIVAAGTPFSPLIAKFINTFAWQGKVFDATKGVLRNRILPLGFDAIIAKVYKDKSWLDGKSASCSTIRTRRSWRIGFATRSALSVRACISARCIGTIPG
jgi:hypothetical protein